MASEAADAWTTPVVDSHVHVFTTDMPLVSNPRHKPAYSFTSEDLIATLDAHGVPMAVIAAASPWGDYNDYTIAALRKYPRLRGTVILKPTVERAVLDEMKRDGVVGVRLPFVSMSEIPDVITPDYRRFLRRLADLDWHVHPHIECEKLPQLLPGLEAAGVKIVIDHIGRPDPNLGINGEGFKAMLRSIEKGRTWVKLSAGYRLGPNAVDCARELVKQGGPERLVWASDCPFVGEEAHVKYQQTIDWLTTFVPDPAARRKIFCDTPLRLYFS
ncbi:MAG TPA: amidohydrolase family protein [Xanthobacteraceae bacterium]|nr:amidohydrolase family protein [Xanthobacteraceae bacterium]